MTMEKKLTESLERQGELLNFIAEGQEEWKRSAESAIQDFKKAGNAELGKIGGGIIPALFGLISNCSDAVDAAISDAEWAAQAHEWEGPSQVFAIAHDFSEIVPGQREYSKITIFDMTQPDFPEYLVLEKGKHFWDATADLSLQFCGSCLIINPRSSEANWSGNGVLIYDFLSRNLEIATIGSGDYSVGSVADWQELDEPIRHGSGRRSFTLPDYMANDVTAWIDCRSPASLDTGHPQPTIAIATNSGVSELVPNERGNWDARHINNFASDDLRTATNVEYIEGELHIGFYTSPNARGGVAIYRDGAWNRQYATNLNVGNHHAGAAPGWLGYSSHPIKINEIAANLALSEFHNGAWNPGALIFRYDNPSEPLAGRRAFTAEGYSTPVLLGDVHCALLCDREEGIRDRSGKGNDASLVGALTFSRPEGADIAEVHGFDASNYLTQSMPNIGTGPYAITGMFNISQAGWRGFFDWNPGKENNSTLIRIHSYPGGIKTDLNGDMAHEAPLSDPAGAYPVTLCRDKDGKARFYVDGHQVGNSVDHPTDLNSAEPALLGTFWQNQAVSASGPQRLSQIYITDKCPSADDIQMIHRDLRLKHKKPCLLTSPAVSVAYDPIRDQRYVIGTDRKLHRFARLSTAIEKTINLPEEIGSVVSLEVVDGAITVIGSSKSWAYQPESNLRNPQSAHQISERMIQLGVGSTTTKDYPLPRGWKPLEAYKAGALIADGPAVGGYPVEFVFNGHRWLLKFAQPPGEFRIAVRAQEVKS